MSTIEGQNFVGQTDPPKADEYIRCNFSQLNCIDDGGVKKGVRLWPRDDTPRTFTRCNLVNCEPPPGSVCIQCNQGIVEKHVLKDTDTVTIDGQVVEVENYVDRSHGFVEDGEYHYFPAAKETPVIREDE